MNIHTFRAEIFILGLSIKEPINGIKISVRSAEISNKDKTLRNCIQLSYRKDFSLAEKALNQEQINAYLIKEFNLLIHSLALLLSRPFQLIAYNFWIDENEVHISLPPRGLPPGIYNIIGIIRRNRINESLLGGYTAEVKPIFWETYELFIDKFHAEFDKNNKRFNLTLEWIVKGNSEVLIGRLIAYWIALNTQYKNLDRQEIEAINIFIKNNIDKTIAKRMVEKNFKRISSLSNKQVILGKGQNKKIITSELKDLLASSERDDMLVIEKTILVVYGIRNSLIHGDYVPDSEETDTIIGLAEQLLSEILKEVIGKHVIGKSLEYTSFIGEEKAGIG